jgi:hypothetical protein
VDVSGNNNARQLAVVDEWGDGICCSGGEGYFVLKVENHVIKAGGDFGPLDEIWFVLANHVNVNVDFEINNDQPQPHPHHDTFQMELLMDNKPSEFSWTLVSESGSKGSDGTSVATTTTAFTGNAFTKANIVRPWWSCRYCTILQIMLAIR